MKVKLSEVKITRPRLPRPEGDMEAMAQSIATFGLLQPIILDENYELLAGFRRFTAHQMNGETEIEAIFRKDINEVMAREIELEENLQRENLDWKSKEESLALLHELKTKWDPNWTQTKTMVAAGLTRQADIADAVKLTNAMKLFPELKGAKNKAQAMKWLEQKVVNVARRVDVKNNPEDYGSVEQNIWEGDSTDLIKIIDSESFHAIITDPPFGVDYDKRMAGTVGEISSYQDDAGSYLKILGMAPEMYRVLKPNGFVVFFFGMSWYQLVVDNFRNAGFNVDPIPLMWDRSDGRSFTNTPDHFFGKGYDVALHAVKGSATLAKQGRSNVFRIPPVAASERDFLVERPVELYAELIRHLTIPGEVVADFFVGSGSCPAAAASLARGYFGIEKDPERRAGAIQKIKAHTPQPK